MENKRDRPSMNDGGQSAKKANTDESYVKARVRAMVLPFFEVIEEAIGQHPVYGKGRLDFLCYPKAEMIAKKWPRRWFGIETKSEGLADQFKRTSALLIRQARIYRESMYEIPGDEVRPVFVLVAPAMSQLLNGCGESAEFQKGYAWALEKVAAFDRVGVLTFRDDSWSVYFHHQAEPSFDSRWPGWLNVAQITSKNVISR